MKTVTSSGIGKVGLTETVLPELPEGYVFVQVKRSVISAGTESALVRNSGQGSAVRKVMAKPKLVLDFFQTVSEVGLREAMDAVRMKLYAHNALGYSLSGIVVASRASRNFFAVGDPVFCAGQEHANHSDYVMVPETYVLPIPEGVDFDSAAMTTVAAIALHALRRSGVGHGEAIAIIGLGLLGQLLVRLCKTLGVRVVGIDPNTQMQRIALEAGAEKTFDGVSQNEISSIRALTKGRLFDAVIVTAGGATAEPINTAVDLARERARIVALGHSLLSIENPDFYYKELELVSSRSIGPGRYDENYEKQANDYPLGYVRWTARRNMEYILTLLQEGSLSLSGLITHRFPYPLASEAFEALESQDSNRIAIILDYPEQPGSVAPLEFDHSLLISPIVEAKGRIQVAISGSGYFSTKVIIPLLRRHPNIQIKWLVCSDSLHGRKICNAFAIPMLTSKFSDVASDPEVSLVFILNKHSRHGPQVVAALEAQKHVFVEKPLALTAVELDKVKNAYERAGDRLLFEGLNRSFSSVAQKMRDAVSGLVDPVQLLYRINTKANAGWYNSKEEGGAFIGEFSHFIDFACWLLGNCRVEEIQAMPLSHERARENLTVVARLSGGHVATFLFTTSGSSAYSKESIEVFSDNTSIVCQDFKTLKTFGLKPEINIQMAQEDKGYAEEIKAVISLLDGKSGIEYPGIERGGRALLASLAAIETLATGQSIRSSGK